MDPLIYFNVENKSIGEDLFLDTKSESDFSLPNIQNIADQLERPHPQSAGTTKSQRRVGTRGRPQKKTELVIVR